MSTQPEALKLAAEYRETMPTEVMHLWARDVVSELRHLHARVQELEAQRVPEGWQLVPIEPTEEMLDAADQADREYNLRAFGQEMNHPQGGEDHWAVMLRAAPQPETRGKLTQLEPVEGDLLPPIGSRVFIRHGRDDDAHACIVTGYYAWGDLGGNPRLHRVSVRLVYEGTDIPQARMLCDCYPTAFAALAAAPQPNP